MSNTPTPDQVAAFLEDRLPHYLDILRHMVAINSFTTNAAGIDRVGDLTAQIFGELGFTTERIASTNAAHGHHMVLARPGDSTPTIGFVSHLDTVFSEAEEIANNFAWRVEGDRIYGPGTVDIKGGTVMIYAMLDALRTFAPDTFAQQPWTILLNAAEEVLAPDFGHICRERLTGARACLVFECGLVAPPRCVVVAGRGGRGMYRVSASGRSVHSGNDHAKGANAIVQLAHAVQQIADFTDYQRRLTFNVGVIRGGTVVNRVPHLAEADVEMRGADQATFHDGNTRIQALEGFSSIRSASDNYACRIHIETDSLVSPWDHNDATQRLVTLWQQSGHALGLRVETETRGGLSDGSWTWSYVPTLDGLGPSGGNMHSSERSADGQKDQEFITISSFVPKTLLNIFGTLGLIAHD